MDKVLIRHHFNHARLLGLPRRGPVRCFAPLAVYALVALAAVGCRKKPDDNGGGSATSQQTSKTISQAWFTEITQEVGLDFVHENGASGRQLLPEIMNGGVALFDYDNDADLDLYFVNGNESLPHLDASDGARNRLYRLNDDGRYEDVTESSGLGDTGYGMGVAIGDIDNDGHPDVYVTNLGHDQLYRNRGDGTFENITKASGVDVDGWSASVGFLDYDIDGLLDIYVVKYVQWAPRKCFSANGRPDYCGPQAFIPVHDVLLHNIGSGRFVDVSESSGIASVKAAGLGVVCEDFNADGRIDLYVTNDAYANHLWINQGNGTFVDQAVSMGAAFNLHGSPEAGMGVTSNDFDQDGDPDLFMTHLVQESNTFYRNLGGDLGFSDVTSDVGLSWNSMPYTGFGVAAFDIELDGDLDLLVLNGRVKRWEMIPNAGVPAPWDELAEPNLLYLNQGRGRFLEGNEYGGTLCSRVEISRGLAVGDIDQDGDMDIVMTNIKSPSRLYRNDAPRSGSWLAIRALDPRLKRDAIGAQVVMVAGARRLTRTISRTFSYMSSSDPTAYFGLGDISHIDRIEVKWLDGLHEWFQPPPLNRRVTLERGGGNKL